MSEATTIQQEQQKSRKPDATVGIGIWEGHSKAGNHQVSIKVPFLANTLYAQAVKAEDRKSDRSPDFRGEQGALRVYKTKGKQGVRYSVYLDGFERIDLFSDDYEAHPRADN